MQNDEQSPGDGISRSGQSVKSAFLSLGVVQMTAQEDIGKNIENLVRLLEKTKAVLDLVTTPENSLFMRGSSEVDPPRIDINDPRLEALSNWCRARKAHLHLGSVPALDPDHPQGRTNATIWIDKSGSRSIAYRKIHLFDVDVEGVNPRRESAQFSPGSSAEIVEINGWKVGLSICYDLRFAELYSMYAEAGVDLILIPSAFLVPTGRAHWEILIRARAIESQCYVAAAAQSGEHRSGESVHRTYGHS